MILDSRNEFADAVSVAGDAGTANIGSQIDIGYARDIGQGGPLYLVITVDTEIITGGNAGTIQFRLVSDDTASIAVDGSATVHWASRLFVTDGTDANDAELKVGAKTAIVPLPMEGVAYERFLGVQAVIASTTVTAGKINAFLTSNPAAWQAYPDATN